MCLSYPALAAKSKKPSNTYQASCVVIFKGNSGIHASAFQGLISSSAITGKAGQDVFNVTDKVIDGFIIIRALVAGSNEYTYELKVNLPDNDPEVKPLAEEFLAALIKNMQSSLNETYNNQRNLLREPLESAQEELNDAMFKFESLTGVTTASKAIEKQLDMTVDVSKLNDDMSLYEALDMLSKSVKPALPITVMWKDLSENGFIEQEEPIGIDGQNMSAVRLGTALDLVLKSIGGNLVKLGYAIEGGILIVATGEQLPATVPTDSHGNLLDTRNNLVADKANYELQIAEYEAYREAILKQIAKVREDMYAKVETDEIAEQLREILQLRSKNLDSITELNAAGQAGAIEIKKAEEDLVRSRIEYVKRRQEVSKEAGGNKINELNDRLGDIAVDVSVRKAMYAVVIKQLNEVDAKLAAVSKSESKRSAIDTAKQALKDAEHNVEILEKQIANLKMPVVTVIGAN